MLVKGATGVIEGREGDQLTHSPVSMTRAAHLPPVREDHKLKNHSKTIFLVNYEKQCFWYIKYLWFIPVKYIIKISLSITNKIILSTDLYISMCKSARTWSEYKFSGPVYPVYFQRNTDIITT